MQYAGTAGGGWGAGRAPQSVTRVRTQSRAGLLARASRGEAGLGRGAFDAVSSYSRTGHNTAGRSAFHNSLPFHVFPWLCSMHI